MLSGMQITINNQVQDIAAGTTLQEIVFAHAGEKQNGIAVAVNNAVISRLHHSSYTLQSNDTILIIKATQGG